MIIIIHFIYTPGKYFKPILYIINVTHTRMHAYNINIGMCLHGHNEIIGFAGLPFGMGQYERH